MKAFFYAGLLTLSLNALAEDCLGRFCIGDIIIDRDNTVGVVKSIEGSQLKYNYNGSLYTVSPSQLAKRTESSQFPEGSLIIDSDNTVGKVKYAFDDNRVQYNYRGSLYVTKYASPETPEKNNTKAGMRIIDSDNTVGVAQVVFQNGKVQYKYNGSLYVTNAASPEVSRKGDLVAESIVIDSDNTVGKLVVVFENGKGQYNTRGSLYVSSRLVSAVNELNGLATGVVAIDRDNTIGTVTYIFRDGRAQYNYRNSLYISNSLVPKVEELNNLKNGKIVIDSDNTIGSVVHIFRDGRAQYSYRNVLYVSKNLSPEIERKGDFSPGVLILDSDLTVGEATHVFANSKMSYKYNNSIYVTSIEKAAHEVYENDLYSKDVTYASDSMIGKPIHFFSNDYLQMENSKGQRSVTNKLYNEVSQIGEIAAETSLLGTHGEAVKVKRLFANNLLLGEVILTVDEKEQVYEAPFKLVLNPADLKEEDLSSMLQELNFALRMNVYVPSKHIMQEEQFFELKELLTQQLEKEASRFSEKDQKNLKEYLSKKAEGPGEGAPSEEVTIPEIVVEPEIPAPVEEVFDGLEVKLNDSNYLSMVKEGLDGKNIIFKVVQAFKGKKTLDISIVSVKKGFRNTCEINAGVSIVQDNSMRMSGAQRSRTAITSGEKNCKKILKDVLDSVVF